MLNKLLSVRYLTINILHNVKCNVLKVLSPTEFTNRYYYMFLDYICLTIFQNKQITKYDQL